MVCQSVVCKQRFVDLLLAVKYKSDSPLVIIICSIIAVVLSTIFALVIVTFIVYRYKIPSLS